VDCAEEWEIEVLEQLCTTSLLLATDAQHLDAPAQFQARLEELIGEKEVWRNCYPSKPPRFAPTINQLKVALVHLDKLPLLV
jgi:hypothetical protein